MPGYKAESWSSQVTTRMCTVWILHDIWDCTTHNVPHLQFGQVDNSPVPSPQSPRGDGSGEIGTVSWLWLWQGQRDHSITCQYACCYATGCKIVELHSDWLMQKQDSWPRTMLFCNRMQYHVKITELQSNWLARKQECWGYKNQENA